MPVDQLEEEDGPFKACTSCFPLSKCAWCAKSTNNFMNGMVDKPADWEFIPLTHWKRIPSKIEQVHASCNSAMLKLISKARLSRPPPLPLEEEEEEARTKKARRTITGVNVDCEDVTSPLTADDEMAVYVLMRRLKLHSEEHATHSGGASVLVGSRKGGPKMQWIHCPKRMGTSRTTLRSCVTTSRPASTPSLVLCTSPRRCTSSRHMSRSSHGGGE